MKSAAPNVPVTKGGAGPSGVSTSTDGEAMRQLDENDRIKRTYQHPRHDKIPLDGLVSLEPTHTNCYGRGDPQEYARHYLEACHEHVNIYHHHDKI